MNILQDIYYDFVFINFFFFFFSVHTATDIGIPPEEVDTIPITAGVSSI